MRIGFILGAIMSAVVTFTGYSAMGQGIKITQVAKSDNPTIKMGTFSGSQAMAAQVRSDIQKCGWFDLVNNDKAEYILSGAASGNALQLRLDRNVGGTGAISVTQPFVISQAETSHRAVDLVLNKVFDIKGICAYKIAFSAEISPGVKEIFVCDFDGSNPRQITKNQTQSIEADWGPNNQSILYTLYGNQNTYVAETVLSSKASRRLSQFKGMNAAPAIAPGSNNYACIMSKDGTVDLYLRNVGGSAVARLTQGKGVEASPCFSPDGRYICFVSDMKQLGKPRLYTIPARGGAINPVNTVGADPTSPDWSLDNKLAYSTKSGLCVTDLSGKAKMGVGQIVSERLESPSWAPDNRHVVAQYSNGRRASLWVVDTWTGKKRPLFSTNVNASLPAWQKR